MTYDIIIPTSAKDASFLPRVISYIRKNLIEANNIYIIANKKLHNKIKKKCNNVYILNEDELIDGLTFDNIEKKINSIAGANIGRTGWYFQQFLKLAFAQTDYCDKYYLTWDADTLPLSHVSFFEKEKPLFTLKKEYNKPYFDTIKRLLGIEKQIQDSFIAEHMLFSKEFVYKLISSIEQTNIKGNNWIEKILYACEDLRLSAFSEFETYGNFVIANYPNSYGFQQLNTFRYGGLIRGRKISDKLLKRISFDTQTISFELKDKPLFPYNIEYYLYLWKKYYNRIKSYHLSEIIHIIQNKI